ncbi:MAG: helix-hairpin-helix domain-containing protein [Myxococcota bacterium]|nr:helix-hairpin-helix domain-containing protein [Myxococcota bacterium]
MSRSFSSSPAHLAHLAHLAQRLSQHLARRLVPIVALVVLVVAMGGSWMLAGDAFAAPPQAATARPLTAATTRTAATTTATADDVGRSKPVKKDVTGKLNLNTATEDQLMLLPTVGPAKAERVVTWRKKNGGFKRTADLRRVKGFGYKTFKRLEPFLDVKGDSTLAARR